MSENLMDLNQNPELAAWLKGLSEEVAKKESRKREKTEPSIFLPRINMGKKFRQVNGKNYPEMQGTITFLPKPYKGKRVIELPNVIELWCPADAEWNRGFTYRILPDEYYPEGEVRNRFKTIRDTLKSYENQGLINWKQVKHRNYSLIKAFVIVHRNTKGDVVTSNLYGGDTLVEHKYVPALIVCPNLKINAEIQTDLNGKLNAVPFALACYSDTPFGDRKGWVTLTFKDSATNAFGYDVKIQTEVTNPAINPEGIVPQSVNLEDDRIKLLETEDPVRVLLDRIQLGDDAYYNLDTLGYLESYVNWLRENANA